MVCVQLTGPVIVPFTVQKQTALLSVMARNFPRLSLGVGPVQTHIASVLDDAALQTAQVTIIIVTNGGQQAFAEVRHGQARLLLPINVPINCLCAWFQHRDAAAFIDRQSSLTSWSHSSTLCGRLSVPWDACGLMLPVAHLHCTLVAH